MTKLLLSVGVVALLLSGCGHQLTVDQARVTTAPDRADEAFEIVANFYGLRARPTIVWYRSDRCGDGTGYIDDTGTCVNGDQDGSLIILSDCGGLPLHVTSIGHEPAHIASDERGEGGDAGHEGHFFRDPGEDLSQGFDRYNRRGDVGAANRLLESLGM